MTQSKLFFGKYSPAMSYGLRLKEALEHAKKTRRELSAAIGQSVQSIGMVIAGKNDQLSTSASAKAAAFLRVDHNWLVTGRGLMLPAVLPAAPFVERREPEPALSADAVYVVHWLNKIKDVEQRERLAHACVDLILREIAAPAVLPTPAPEPGPEAPSAAPRARPGRRRVS